MNDIKPCVASLQMQLDAANSKIAELQAEIEMLKGVKPELPPFPPEGKGLPRYGISWNGEYMPITKPMDGGYWTPFHLAEAENERLRIERDDHLSLIDMAIKTFDDYEMDVEQYPTIAHIKLKKSFKNQLTNRDLEQQAKGVEDARKHNVRMKRKFGTAWGAGHIIEDLQTRERLLRNQAKQEDQGE